VFGSGLYGIAGLSANGSWCGICGVGGALLLLDTVAQGVGLALLFAGVVSSHGARHRSGGSPARRWAIVPGSTSAPLGLTFVVVDF
jgi:hypothetical protein